MSDSSGDRPKRRGVKMPSDPTIDLEDLELELEPMDLLSVERPSSPPPVPPERLSKPLVRAPLEPRVPSPGSRSSQPPPPPGKDGTGPGRLARDLTSQPPPPPEIVTSVSKSDGRQATVPGVPLPRSRRSNPPAPPSGEEAATASDALPTIEEVPGRAVLPAPEQMLATLEAELKHVGGDRVRQARLLDDMARLEEERRGEMRAARSRYRAALEAHPDLLHSIRALRRLEDTAGNPAEAIRLIEQEIRLTADDRQRACRSAELGRALEARHEIDRAIASYRRALELHGGCHDAIEALVALYQADKQWVPLSEVLLRAASNTTDRRRKAVLTARAANVREVYLEQDAAAEALLATALGHDPDLGQVGDELARLYRARGRWAELARLEQAEAGRAETDDEKGLRLYRAGRVFADRAGDPVAAEECFIEAMSLSPGFELARRAVADIQRRRGDFEGLERTLVEGLARSRDRARSVAARFEVARVRTDRLGKVDEAVEALQEALQIDPRHTASLRALEDIFVEQGRFDELVEVAAAEVDRLRDEVGRADAYHELGQLVERHLEDADRAAYFYRAALDLVPEHAAAFDALDRLYARQGAWAELIDLLESAAEATPDRERAAARLARAAELSEHRLGANAKAIALARKILAMKSEDLASIARLGRLLEAEGAWTERVELLRKEAGLAGHEPERLALLMRIATLYEIRLESPERARNVYREVLGADPGHGAALRALGRLERRSGRFEDLVATLRHELSAGAAPDDAAVLHYRIGRLLEEKLGRTDEALTAYRACVAEDPTYAPAMDAIERLLRGLSRWKELAELLETAATSPAEGTEARALAWFRVGELREERLGNDDGALDAYREALKLLPEYEPARQSVLRILESKGRWNEVAGVLEAEAEHRSGKRRLQTLLRLSNLRATRLGDLAGAMAALVEAEADAPDDLAVQDALVHVGREQRDWERLGRAYARLAAAAAEPRDAAAVLHRAALDARAHPAIGDPVAIYRQILELTPEDGTALLALEDVALSSSDQKLLLEVTSRRLDVEPAEELRLPLLLRQAELRAAAQDVEGAVESYERALALDETCLVALRGLSSLRAAAGEHAEVADLREREASALADPASSTRALVEAGEIRLGALGQPDEALRCFRRVLEIAPGHGIAYHRLTGILESFERWEDLAEAISTRLSSVADEADEVGLRLRLAAIQRDRLDQPEEAVSTLKGLLAIEPDNRKALEALGDIYSRLGRWREAADSHERAARAADLRKEAKAAHRSRLALAELQLRRLGEFDEAVRTLATALQKTPGDLTALELRVEVQRRRGDVAAAAAALSELAEALPPGGRSTVLTELADLLLNDADDTAGGALALQRAAADSPGDREPVRRLSEHFGKLGDPEGLARALGWAVDHARGEPAATALLRVELATTLIEKQGRVAAGVEHLEAVLEVQPGNAAARFAMARRHMMPPGRPDLAEQEYRRVLVDDPWNVEALRELFRLLATGKDPSRAAIVAMLLTYLGGTEAAAAAVLGAPSRLALGPEGYDRWVSERAEPPIMCALLRSVQGSLEKVYPLDLERHGASKEDRAGPGDILTAAVGQVGTRLAVGPVETYASHRNRNACALEPGDPMRIVVGVNLTSLAPGVRRFELGRALGPIIGGSALFSKVPRRELPALLSAVIGNVVRGYGRMGDPDEVVELTKRVGRALNRRQKKVIEEPARRAATAALPDVEAWMEAAERSADRCGLLASADIGACLDAVRARDEARAATKHEAIEDRLVKLRGCAAAEALARYWLSPRCEEALSQLGTP